MIDVEVVEADFFNSKVHIVEGYGYPVLVFDTVNNVFEPVHVGGLLLDDSVYRCFEGSVGDIVCVVHGVISSLCCRRYRLGSIYCLRTRLG